MSLALLGRLPGFFGDLNDAAFRNTTCVVFGAQFLADHVGDRFPFPWRHGDPSNRTVEAIFFGSGGRVIGETGDLVFKKSFEKLKHLLGVGGSIVGKGNFTRCVFPADSGIPTVGPLVGIGLQREVYPSAGEVLQGDSLDLTDSHGSESTASK